MSAEKRIFYADHPHFKVGKHNQFYQQGYFYYDGDFYFYDEDNHEGTYYTNIVASNMDDFADYMEEADLDIPDSFWDAVEDQ